MSCTGRFDVGAIVEVCQNSIDEEHDRSLDCVLPVLAEGQTRSYNSISAYRQFLVTLKLFSNCVR